MRIRYWSSDVCSSDLSSAEFGVEGESLAQAAVILLVLRAFSSGCSALTGVEAVANGVPAFRRPKVGNAQMTLPMMGLIAIDRKSVVWGKGVSVRVDIGGRGTLKKKKTRNTNRN